MTTDILGCTVYIDGERFADGRVGDDLRRPVALDGLKVTWGRETTIDQPDPSTCTFEVMDTSGGTAFLNRLYVGALVQVRTAAEVTDTPEENIVVDPGFEGTEVGQTPATVEGGGSLVTPPVVVDLGGTHALRLVPTTTTQGGGWVEVAPGPRVTGDPDAWDDILMIGNIAEWGYSVEFTAPPGTYYNVQAYTWAAPDLYANGLGSATVTSGHSPGGTITVAKEFTVSGLPRQEWLGFRVSTSLVSWAAFSAQTNAYDAWQDVPPGLTWADYGASHIDNVKVAPVIRNPGLVVNESVVFEGSITDLATGWDESLPPAGGARTGVTATDFTGQLNNVYVGDTPWPLQQMGTRFARVGTLANQQTAAAGRMGWVIAPSLGTVNLQRQDVDRQSAFTLLTNFVESVDGVLWPAVHLTSPRRYFYVEDIDARTSGYRLVYDAETGTVRVDRSGLAGRTHLSACDLLRDTVGYEQSTSDVTTRVAIGWSEEGVDEEGNPSLTDRTYEDVDLDAETHLGVSRLQVTTLLASQVDAAWHADRKLRRLGRRVWRASGVVWDLDLTPYTLDVQKRAQDLLDGTSRIGLPIVITDLPSWTPTGAPTLPLYVEGGEYEFTSGRWVLTLLVSDVYGSGASAEWDTLPGAGSTVLSSRTNYARNPSAVGAVSGDTLPGFALYTPGADEAGTSMSSGGPVVAVPLRTNYCANPRAMGTASAGWAYQAGTGEVSTAEFRMAQDGPVVEGFRIPSYRRVRITTPKTGGNSGHFYRSAAGALPLTAGDQWHTSVLVRVFGTAPVRVRLALNARNGSAAGASEYGPWVTLAPQTGFHELRATATAAADADGFQVWVQMGPDDALPSDGGVDVTALCVEYGPDDEAPYFDGSFGFIDEPGDMRYAHAWTGTADASRSTQSLTLTPRVEARDGAPGGGPRTLVRRIVSTPKTGGESGFVAREAALRAPVVGASGDQVTVSVWLRHTPARDGTSSWDRPRVRLRAEAFNAAGSVVASADSAEVALFPSEWARLSVTVIATGAYASVGWSALVGPAQHPERGSVLDATGVLVEKAPTVGAFFDGDHGDTGTATYEWTGAARNSPSTEVLTDGWTWDRFADDVTWNDLSGATTGGT